MAESPLVATYPLKVNSPPWITILQISDLHFRSDRDTDEQRIQWLKDFHARLKRSDVPPIDIIAVTGDVVDYRELRQKSHLSTLRAAKAYLLRLCMHCGVDPATQLIVVPGNHDCRWSGIFGFLGW